MPSRKASGLGANSAHEARRVDLPGRQIGADATFSRSTLQAVYDGSGHIELIDGAFIAVDTTGQTLGTFATLRAAVASFGGGPQ